MTTISLKLPEGLLARLEKESRARRTTKSSLVRECLERQLPSTRLPEDLPELPPGESCYDQALPILKRAWARNRKLPRDLATNPKYLTLCGGVRLVFSGCWPEAFMPLWLNSWPP